VQLYFVLAAEALGGEDRQILAPALIVLDPKLNAGNPGSL
jgi:hypothetical protein